MNSGRIAKRVPRKLADLAHRNPTPPLRTFAELADIVAHRWTTERDTWLAPSELAAARAFLAAAGVATTALPDGSFMIEEGSFRALSGPRLFLLALRRFRGGPEDGEATQRLTHTLAQPAGGAPGPTERGS